MGEDTKAKAQNADKNTSVICKKIAALVKSGVISKYRVEESKISPGGTEYYIIDIDGDGKTDSIKVGNGSEGSSLFVLLSDGRKYDIEEGGFIDIIKLKGHVYAKATLHDCVRKTNDSLSCQKTGYRLYLLTNQSAKLICENYKGGR